MAATSESGLIARVSRTQLSLAATRVEPATRRADDASFSGNSEAFLTEAEAFLRSKRFLGPVHGFLADNCPAFANAAVDSECTHEQQEIHNVRIPILFRSNA